MIKFTSRAVSEHAEVPLADHGRWEEIVESWEARSGRGPTPAEAEENADYVVSVGTAKDPAIQRAQLSEIVSLVRSQGDRVVGEETCHVPNHNPRTLLGKGQAEALAARARECGANMLVLDAELSPSQTRNLEDLVGLAICDREAIILNVFLRHARTRRARIQVEIAQLEYLRPRIRGVGLDMDQQTGGMAGARGPGETASELLARKLDRRLIELHKARARLQTSSEIQRRTRASCERIVLVGYTNAGKTSLMNALTGAELSARDMPFETLDTTSRCLTRHGGSVILSDTVGFIRRLPERLLESFESTLDEIAEASLLVIVVDAADCEAALHISTTTDVLARLGADRVPRLYVFNKVDCLGELADARAFAAMSGGHPFRAVSARDPQSVIALKTALIDAVASDEGEVALFVPYSAAATLSAIYARCRVIKTEATATGLKLTIRGAAPVIARVRASLEEERR